MEIRNDLRSYAKMASNRMGWVAGQLEVCSGCYQHCAGCESWRDDIKDVQRGSWSLYDLKKFCTELVTSFPHFEHLALTGGDPQFWPHLDEFLDWWVNFRHVSPTRKVRLQLNTALTQTVNDPMLWRTAVDDIRVSLDAIDPDLYMKIRGDKVTRPADVLERMRQLAHPGLATNTTVFPFSIQEMFPIVKHVGYLQARGCPIRKASFLPVLGPRGKGAEGVDYWKEWRHQLQSCRVAFPRVTTSAAENPGEVREYLEAGKAKDIRCHAGSLTFHVKCNGDVYPCCLMGGEALPTKTEFRIGKWPLMNVQQLYDRYVPKQHYHKNSPCVSICQYKQFCTNVAAEEASRTHLAMP